MMSKTERIAAAYAAFNRKDAAAVLALMAADVDWPNAIEGTRLRGHEAVRAYWAAQWANIDPQVDPRKMEELDGERVAVEVHQVVRDRAGAVLIDQRVEHVYTFENGLIRRMDIQQPSGGKG